MSVTYTPNIALGKPARGDSSWDSVLNADLDIIDTLFSTATFTSGSVAFFNSSGALAQDNAYFFWDTTNKKLLVKRGTNANSTGQPSGTFAQTIYNGTVASGEHGLLVKNCWNATDSTAFQVGIDIPAGAFSSLLSIDGTGVLRTVGGVVVGSPTGDNKGGGSLNAVTVWRNGTSLDKVFEPNYDLLPLEELRAYYEEHRTLPTIPSSVVEDGSVEMGRLTDGLWETVECQARYIVLLHERLAALEKKV